MQSNRYLPAEATPASVGLMGKERFLPLLKSSDYELQSLKWLTLPHSNKRTPVQSQLNSLLFFHPPSSYNLLIVRDCHCPTCSRFTSQASCLCASVRKLICCAFRSASYTDWPLDKQQYKNHFS